MLRSLSISAEALKKILINSEKNTELLFLLPQMQYFL